MCVYNLLHIGYGFLKFGYNRFMYRVSQLKSSAFPNGYIASVFLFTLNLSKRVGIILIGFIIKIQ